jgi:hypothetical protein
MEMGYRDHIVAKLSALAVAGGTTAMLFAATPVHTQFSATTSGSLSAAGANVALTLSNGTLKATNLLPAVTTGPVGSQTTTYYPTNSQNVTLKNTGSVPETFTMIISNYACGSLAHVAAAHQGASVTKALEQLKVVYNVTTMNGTTPSSSLTGAVAPFLAYKDSLPAGDSLPACSSTGGYTTLASPISISLGSIAPSATDVVNLEVELAADSGVNANDWNGAAGVEIPYTIQAEPDDAGAAVGTSTGPTLSGVVSTPAPKKLKQSGHNAAG